MKVLLIGNFARLSNVSDAGYQNAAMGMYSVLNRMSGVEVAICDYNKLMVADKGKYDISLSFIHPNSFINPQLVTFYRNFTSDIKVNILNVVWETIPLPKMWDTVFELDIFQGFSFPANFLLETAVTKKPKFLLPHHVNIDTYKAIDPKKKEVEPKFTCLFIGQYTARKGLDECITGFARALGDKVDTEFLVKYHLMSNNDIPIDVFLKAKALTNSKPWLSTVNTFSDSLTFEQMNHLYKGSSLFFNLSRGEGFGLGAVEAMACGLPVLYTDWGAMKDTGSISPANRSVECFLDHAVGMSNYGFERESQYAFPRVDAVYKGILDYYNEWKSDKIGYYARAAVNREAVNKNFGQTAIESYLKNIFKHYGV